MLDLFGGSTGNYFSINYASFLFWWSLFSIDFAYVAYYSAFFYAFVYFFDSLTTLGVTTGTTFLASSFFWIGFSFFTSSFFFSLKGCSMAFIYYRFTLGADFSTFSLSEISPRERLFTSFGEASFFCFDGAAKTSSISFIIY